MNYMFEKMVCRPMATLMSPATFSLPDMKAIMGSRLPSARADEIVLVNADGAIGFLVGIQLGIGTVRRRRNRRRPKSNFTDLSRPPAFSSASFMRVAIVSLSMGVSSVVVVNVCVYGGGEQHPPSPNFSTATSDLIAD